MPRLGSLNTNKPQNQKFRSPHMVLALPWWLGGRCLVFALAWWRTMDLRMKNFRKRKKWLSGGLAGGLLFLCVTEVVVGFDVVLLLSGGCLWVVGLHPDSYDVVLVGIPSPDSTVEDPTQTIRSNFSNFYMLILNCIISHPVLEAHASALPTPRCSGLKEFVVIGAVMVSLPNYFVSLLSGKNPAIKTLEDETLVAFCSFRPQPTPRTSSLIIEIEINVSEGVYFPKDGQGGSNPLCVHDISILYPSAQRRSFTLVFMSVTRLLNFTSVWFLMKMRKPLLVLSVIMQCWCSWILRADFKPPAPEDAILGLRRPWLLDATLYNLDEVKVKASNDDELQRTIRVHPSDVTSQDCLNGFFKFKLAELMPPSLAAPRLSPLTSVESVHPWVGASSIFVLMIICLWVPGGFALAAPQLKGVLQLNFV